MDKTTDKPLNKPFELLSSTLPAPGLIHSRGRHRTLAWLLAVTGAVSVALLLVALLAAGRASQEFQDVNLSGSLRFRSLWIYGASHQAAQAAPEQAAPNAEPGETIAAQMDAMRGIRRHLSQHYPGAVAATDPAWDTFSASLRQTGQVDWQTANALRVASNLLTQHIAKEASAQNTAAASLLGLGLGGLMCALTACGFLLSGLRTAETEMRLALADLQENRDLFLRSINAVQEGYLVVGREGMILLCNAEAERLLGASAPELIGGPVERPGRRLVQKNGEAFGPGQTPPALALRTGQPQEAVVVGLARPGMDQVWFSAKAAPVFHAGQEVPYAAVLTFTDISAKQKSEEALRVQEEALQQERDFQTALLESLEAGIVACDAEGILTLFNRAAREFHGLPPQPLPPEEWPQHFDLFEPDGITPLATVDVPLFRAWTGEVVRDAEMVIAPKDSPARTLLASGQAIYGPAGQKLGAVVAMHDITASRRIERELSRLASIVQSSEEAILALTLDGTIVIWNAGADRLYGYTEGEVIGHHASVLVPEGQESVVDTMIARLLRGEALAPVEVVRCRRDGAVLNLALTFSPLYDAQGEVVGLSCISRDITARRQAEDALRESEARLRYLSDAAFEGIAVSRNGVILDANAAFLTLYGCERAQMLGLEGVDLVVPEDRALVRQKIASGEEETYAAKCLRRDGSTFQAEIRGRMVLWDGLPARVTAIRDVTERKAMEDSLRHSEEALRAMLGSAPVILYAADLAGIITLSEGMGLAALGLAPGEAVGRSVFEFTKSDAATADYTLRALAGEAVSYDRRYGALWLHVELKPQHDLSGAIVGIIGVCFDITERAQSEERFRVLFEQSSDAHLLFDDDGIIDCNAAALAMMRGTDKARLLGVHPARLSPERQPDGRLSREKGDEMCALARKNGTHHFEWARLALDGAEIPVAVTLTEVRLNEKPVLLSVWHDLTERKQAEQQIKDYMVILEFQKNQLEDTNKELEALATTDGLTGLKNRRTFGEKLAEEYARAARYHQPLSVLLLDVDHFKQYNDTFGHPAGDAVLRSVAQALGNTARDTDVAARYGGEEFVVILPQTDEAGALVIAERVRAAIAGEDWELRPITVSVGVSTLSLDTPTPDSLTACADKALYQSKDAGRNRVTHGNPAAPLVSSRAPRVRRSRSAAPAAESQAQADLPK